MKYTEIWREARRLHRLGFAIHWLMAHSKRPVESGWTTGPRKDWKELNQTYQNGFNVGVRLGSPSELNGKYLAVVDVDVKSSDERHRKEALSAAKKLLNGEECPEVRSGRGNGSRHYYCVTEKPFKTFNPFQSDEMVKVLMPSKRPSKDELNRFSEAEIKQGWRLSRAWEVSLYSDGRQVVLPPSVHPDTGRPYFWQKPLLDADALPCLQFDVPKERTSFDESDLSPRSQQETVEDFQIDETLDIRWLPGITDRVRKLITDGTWKGRKIEDRSSYLLPATNGLVSAGLDKNAILTVLTDRSTFLGACAYDHAQTNSRKRAAKWLWNYTVKRVMNERNPILAFEGKEIEIAKTLDQEDAKDQADEIEDITPWRQKLEMTKHGSYKNSFNNCQIILTHAPEQKDVLGRNDFAANDYYLCSTPWGGIKNAPVTDDELLKFKKYCVDEFGIEFSLNMVDEVFRAIASRNRFHPVRDFLKSLEWDGVPRIETWLKEYAGAEGPDEYIRAVSRKVLVAMVKRIFEPGCKFDHVLILEGLQGAGKSTLLANLAAPWFSDETLNIGDKDAVLTMQSKWLIELGELSALSRAELETTKAFISRRVDRIRAPYGKRVEEFPRQCIFIGSTNQDEYLKDETGNRRFWPVKIGDTLDFETIAKIRDQLFAEAYAFYLLKEPLYLETKELNALAKIEQDRRGEIDEWLPTIRDLVEADGFPIKAFEMREVSKSMEQFGANRLTPWDQKRIAKCLRFLGFERFQEKGGKRRKLWRATERFNGTVAEPRGTAAYGSTKTAIPVDFF